jgi:hypothetical protein
VVGEIDKAILKTIKYGRRFEVEYSLRDVEERLIGKNIYSEEKIEKAGGKLGIRNEEIGIKNKIQKQKLIKANKLAELISGKFSNILFVGVTGSVAAGYPNAKDDIDLMVICKNDSLWITRLRLRVFIWKNRIPHRKWRAKERADEFCFNLWLEEESLKLPKNKRSLQNAMDLILMAPLINRKNVYQRFLRKNGWAKNYVNTGYSKRLKGIEPPTPPASAGRGRAGRAGRALANKFINYLAFIGQYWYMKRKMTTEFVSWHQAFFHPKKS